MNYRHAYHAGNFADVLKHVVLTLVIEHMKLKPAPFRIIDTHAGIGRYDLAGVEAAKTGEWRDGIGRLIAEEPPEPLRALLAPYLDIVRAANGGGGLRCCPGSPAIARALMRPGDRLIANELHPDDADRLQQHFAGDAQVKVLRLDAWIALKALLPPKERRGIVLVDPPFEEPGEFDRILKGLREALHRFATGTYLLWFPIKDAGPIATFYRGMSQLAPGRALRVELMIRTPRNAEALNGCGVLVVNPPFTLAAQLERLLPYLSARLAQAEGAGHRLARIEAPRARTSV
jgi:23S rRNA (adenine2030-N6)-methyltransferase